MTKDFTQGNPAKQLFFFTMPLLLGSSFQQLYNIVDSIVVGRFLGKNMLAAIGASFPVIFAIISLIIGVGSGFTIVVSQYFGAKQNERVKATISTMYFFVFGFSAIATTLSLLFSKEIFLMLNLPEHLLKYATVYFNIYISGLILFFGFSGTSAILRGLGDSKTPLYFLIFSTLLNIILDILFVLYLHTEIEGIAYATIISQGLAFVLLALYVHKKNTHLQLSISNIQFDTDIFKKALRIGLPSGVQMVAVSLGMVIVSRIVNDFGTEVIAAYTIAMRIDSLGSLPAMSYSQALSAFTGQNIGANKLKRVMQGYKTCLLQSTIICVIITLSIVFWGNDLMRLFTRDEEVIRIGTEYLIIVSSFYALFNLLFNSNGALRGAGDTIIPMFITIIALWVVRIPMAYYLSDFLKERGIWYAIPLGWAVGAILSSLYFFSGRWKNKGIIKRVPTNIDSENYTT